MPYINKKNRWGTILLEYAHSKQGPLISEEMKCNYSIALSCNED